MTKRNTKLRSQTFWLIVPNEMEAHPELWGPYNSEGERDIEIARLSKIVHKDVFAYTLNVLNGVPSVELVFPDDYEEEDEE
jgi:hypothetical protein